MKQHLKFYKEETGRWYVDLPEFLAAGGEKADLEMVFGADTWLDILSNQGKAVEIEISSDEELDNHLILTNIDESGACYKAETFEGVRYDHVVWLCPVTIFVFGKFPEKIYYKI